MPLSRGQFESGMSAHEYIDQIKVNKGPFVEIYKTPEIPSGVAEWVSGLSSLVQSGRVHRRLVRRRRQHRAVRRGVKDTEGLVHG